MLHDTVADHPPLRALRSRDLRHYLSETGWQRDVHRSNSRQYTVWEHPATQGDCPRVIVPNEDGGPHHVVQVVQALQSLADVEERAVVEVLVNVAVLSDNHALREVLNEVLAEMGASLGRCYRMFGKVGASASKGWAGLTREHIKTHLGEFQQKGSTYVSDDAIDQFVNLHELPEDLSMHLDAILSLAARWYAGGIMSRVAGSGERTVFDGGLSG